MNRKESKPFGESGIWKWLVLAGFLLLAGCLFSCGASEVSMEVELSGTEASDSSDKAGEAASAEADTVDDETETQSEGITETAAETIKETITEERDCFVYVCGEVRSPGVYCMKEGQRIFEAVEQAGGFTEQAVGEYLNLADRISDGMKVFVPSREQVESGQVNESLFLEDSGNQAQKSPAGDNLTGSAAVKVNLNTASKEELMTLRGIGSARAEDIIRYRETNGKFQKIEDIKKVSGIKDAAFEKIKDQITV